MSKVKSVIGFKVLNAETMKCPSSRVCRRVVRIENEVSEDIASIFKIEISIEHETNVCTC
jgi:hypothetical protein